MTHAATPLSSCDRLALRCVRFYIARCRLPRSRRARFHTWPSSIGSGTGRDRSPLARPLCECGPVAMLRHEAQESCNAVSPPPPFSCASNRAALRSVLPVQKALASPSCCVIRASFASIERRSSLLYFVVAPEPAIFLFTPRFSPFICYHALACARLS